MPRDTNKAHSKKIPPELDELAEQVGTFIEYWGFKKVHGKIWANLFLSSEPLDAGELRSRLKVSKALISMSLSELISYDVVLELGKGPNNTLVYGANPDCTRVIVNVLRGRERRILSRVQASFRTMRDLSSADRETAPLDPKRIRMMGEMIQTASKFLDDVIAGDEFKILE
jgi:DNA-binding transcriptional regulator GbsR (MarR family)